ncbi:MAG: (Fe-S)-binding protein [Thermoproteota archaeon]|jgi:Fe-S oxidoreductase|uniref:(Fe-S)-binding protein n=1 Tax=Candidatus Methanodesulfokora washburnensis TaxID=2478471 RepID=A0A3R9PF95_9CREN|nr:heterodisulfide reductase-related iron-sulfur binding cluster [Candidatus Methanodesulfokores washburnensis]RSN72829.1 (Fe-S)-binding protein [Candidatus Methanodesulfokores washburnensis]RZN63754.1 MAG: (Fe-S)-binding protein [Candidatus Methanodesulfokores washburnensis]TDA40888.1 MAG: (Fe-S)-binding protein [Candidatus Korarchaeota archaeon]
MKIEKEVEDAILKCAQCFYCRVCPAFTVIKWESVSPRGKLYALRGIKNGVIKLDQELVEDFFRCTTCGACEEVCQTSLNLVDLWEKVRNDLVKDGKAPLVHHKRIRDLAEKFDNPYGEPREKREEWIRGFKYRDSGDTIYFAGCTASFRAPEIAKSTVNLFNKAGLEVAYLGRYEYCCGSPFLRTGQRDIAYEFFKKNIEEWRKRGVKRIITSCAGCYRTLLLDYPKIAKELGYEWNFEVLHSSQVLNKLIKEGKISPRKLDATVTYHDPCHLGRHAKVYEEPREVIRAMGANLVEMERNRGDSFCCGSGGGVKSQFKDLALSMGKIRINEARETGAEYLISCCPFCKYHMKDAAKAEGIEIKVVDLVEVLDELVE